MERPPLGPDGRKPELRQLDLGLVEAYLTQLRKNAGWTRIGRDRGSTAARPEARDGRPDRRLS
jgi:hypothetical protein